MKKITLMVAVMFTLNGCIGIIPQRNFGTSSSSTKLVNYYYKQKESVDELCQLLQEIDDSVVTLTCSDNEKGIISFTKWAPAIFLLPI